MAWAGDGTFLTVLDVIFCRIFGFVGDVAACTARGGGEGRELARACTDTHTHTSRHHGRGAAVPSRE